MLTSKRMLTMMYQIACGMVSSCGCGGGSGRKCSLSQSVRGSMCGDSRSGAGPTLDHELVVTRDGVQPMAKLGFGRGARGILRSVGIVSLRWKALWINPT